MKDVIKKILLFILLFVFFLYSDLIYIVPLELMGIKVNKLSYNMQTFGSTISSLVVLIVLVIVYRKYLKEKLSDYKKNFNTYFDLGMKAWVVGLTLMCISNILIANFSPVKEATNEVLVQEMLNQAPLLSFISAALIAPFVEEMLFRKALGDIFNNKKNMILVSGLVFGLLHVVFSFESAYDFLYVIPYGFLGAAFAYLLYKKDNVFIPITFHLLHNTILTLMSILLTVI